MMSSPFILLLFATLGIFGLSEAIKCYDKHRNAQVCAAVDKSCQMKYCDGPDEWRGCGECTPEEIRDCNCQSCHGDLCNGGDFEFPAVNCHYKDASRSEVRNCQREHYCHMENCGYGYVSRSCGKCRESNIRECNCKQCKGNVCNIDDIKNPYYYCYEQYGSADSKHLKKCHSSDNHLCFKQNCHGRIERGCGECQSWAISAGCICENCTGDSCNVGEIVPIKCYEQKDEDSDMVQKQCSTLHGNFCKTIVCMDGDLKIRQCGKCDPNQACECYDCDTELCNGAIGIYGNANNWVVIGGTLVVIVTRAMLEMTQI